MLAGASLLLSFVLHVLNTDGCSVSGSLVIGHTVHPAQVVSGLPLRQLSLPALPQEMQPRLWRERDQVGAKCWLGRDTRVFRKENNWKPLQSIV